MIVVCKRCSHKWFYRGKRTGKTKVVCPKCAIKNSVEIFKYSNVPTGTISNSTTTKGVKLE